MLTPALRLSLIPSPADLRASPASPWIVKNGVYSQSTIDSSLDLRTLREKKQIDAMVSSRLLFDMAKVLDEVHGPGHRLYPTALMLMLLALARGKRSERHLCDNLAVNGGDDTWTHTCDRWQEAHGESLPWRAPRREDLRRFRRWATRPEVLRTVLVAFRRASLNLARELGAFGYHARADLADIWVFNVLLGDGTIATPYSDLEEVLLPDGTTVVYGTRAKDDERKRYRVQHRSTDNGEDGKSHLKGLNITHVGVMTPAGYLVLAADQVDRSEGAVALDLVDDVVKDLPNGAVHAVVYDRALTGWHSDYLLGTYGIPVVSKASPSSLSRKNAPEHVQNAWKTSKTSQKKAKAAQAKLRSKSIRQLGHTERNAVAEEALIAAFNGQTSLNQQPGLTLHRNSRGVPQIVYSAFAELGTATHDTAFGPCGHRLVVDDNTLAVVDEHGLKQQQPQLLRSWAERGQDGFTITATWQILCPQGDFEHTETWTPRTERCPMTKSQRDQATPRQKALSLLRLIPQTDPRWPTLAGLRNQPESWHKTYKATLPEKRASSPSAEDQLLQYIATAVLNNSERWYRNWFGERHRQLSAD